MPKPLPPIGNREKALIHVAKSQLGLSEEDYRAALGSVGVTSSTELNPLQFDELMRRFESGGFRYIGRKSKRQRPARDRESLVGKINALLADAGLPEVYADGIAKKMFDIERFIWCAPEQLWKIAAALSIYRKRKGKNENRVTGKASGKTK